MKDANSRRESIDKYLVDITGKIRNYTRSTEVWDRDELKQALKDITEESGMLGCLLGGKSTGKSLAIRDLIRTVNTPLSTQVIYVDLRLRIDILDGLVRELEILSGKENMVEGFIKRLFAAIETHIKIDESLSLSVNLERVYPKTSREEKLTVLLQGLNDISGDLPLTLIIDEANLAFRKSAAAKGGDGSVAYALETLVAYTKQLQAVSSPYISQY